MHSGYVLTHATHASSFTQLIHSLSLYAEWCRVSSAVLDVNTPTVVQMLFELPSREHYNYGHGGLKFSFASSVSAGKGAGREDIRKARTKTVQSVWQQPLPYPTPVQQAHAAVGIRYSSKIEPSAELFGTPWGHCGESVSFPS